MHGKEEVQGMVIVDSAAERTKLPDDWPTLLADASCGEVVGLEATHIFSDKGWKGIQESDEGTEATVAAEEKYMTESTTLLNESFRGNQLLGDGRLSVIFGNEPVDFRKVYECGMKHGNGTEAAREA